jgi:hypothetical protein
MDTVEDIKKYIAGNYGVSPEAMEDGVLAYHSITFERAKGSVLDSNKTMQDFWRVQRKGHSIDFYKSEDLAKQLDSGGNLLYWFIPEE